MSQFLLLPVLLLGAWFWLDGMRAKEQATRAARRACERHELQLLDETVVLVRLRLGRDHHGRAGWRRRYRFEFTREGDIRSQGEVELLGRWGIAMHLSLGPFTRHEFDQSAAGGPPDA